jgi:FkbM family methyltransferase
MSNYRNYLSYKNGAYIELGALDGFHWSNTKWLHDDLGWHGILIEPSKNGYDACLKNRPYDKSFNCACVSFDYKENTVIGDFQGHPMNSVNGTRLNSNSNITVEARTLQSIIEECGYNQIDFLSLDVEGYEFEVLKGIDFKKTTINYMLIEVYDSYKKDMFSFLSNHGYECLENVTNFSYQNNPNWSGDHNDYFFGLK